MKNKQRLELAWENYFYHREMMERAAKPHVKRRHRESMEQASAQARYLDWLPKADVTEKLATIKAVESTGKYGHSGLGKEYNKQSLRK